MTLGHRTQPKMPHSRDSAPAGTLLLVCGEDLSRRVLKLVLEAAGYRVLEALHLVEGMRVAGYAPQRPDLAVVVAGLEGGIWASLDLLRSALGGAPLLVMSPEEVGWLLDSLDGDAQNSHGKWLARVHLVLREGSFESGLALNMA